MQFPNAYKGIKKIFTAEIIILVGQLLLVPMYLMLLLGVSSDELTSILEEKAPSYLWVLLILIAGALISMVVGHIITIIGVVNATKDDNAFKISLAGIVVALAASVASIFLSGNSMLSAICSTTSEIASIVVTFFIIQGIRHIAIKLEDDIIEMKGVTIFKIYFIIVLIAASTHFVSKAFNNEFGYLVNIILIIIGAILTVVQYILYISYLKKARKMLEE